jgi:predicted PurR-regulated permease PerM
MAKSRIVPTWQNAIIVLSGTVVSLIIIAGLQWGRPVLIPIALAILLTFLLNPLVKKLQMLGPGRLPAVILAVSAAGLAIVLVGGLVVQQVSSLVAELPQNTANIKLKVRTLRQLSSGPLAKQFERMVEEISNDTVLPFSGTGSQPIEVPKQELPKEAIVSSPGNVGSESTLWLGLTGYLSSALEVLATLAFSLILLVIFLISRDDLRDRVVVLAGRARVAVTSKALEDVTERISRYLVMVALLNGGFGLILTAGLFALQVQYAFLWGFIAGSLRFIPYLGPWIGAACPIAMSLATSDGWFQPLAVFGFIMVVELVSNNILEPWVFGRSTGVSSTALIISAAFWLYLWGPLGLALSTPIAVCLMVLGRNIPQLSFLYLLMGSEPALNADMGVYQRFMLGDEHEATRLIIQGLKTSSADKVFDEMLIPTLNFAKRDLLREQLTEEDHRLILDGVEVSLGHTDEFLGKESQTDVDQLALSVADESVAMPVTSMTVNLLVCPADDISDFVATETLRQSLSPVHWCVERTAVETLTSELVARILLDPPAILLIVALPPRGLAHARYLCKRLREAAPQLQIIVGRWGRKRNNRMERGQLEQSGATFVTTSLVETCRLLNSRLPLLKQESTLSAQERNAEPMMADVPAASCESAG